MALTTACSWRACWTNSSSSPGRVTGWTCCAGMTAHATTGLCPEPSARLTCRAICSALRELIAPSACAQQAASPIRASTACRLASPAPIPATASSALETAVRSWRTSRSISSSVVAGEPHRRGHDRDRHASAARTPQREPAAGARGGRDGAACARRAFVDCICETSVAWVGRPSGGGHGQGPNRPHGRRIGRAASIRGRGDKARAAWRQVVNALAPPVHRPGTRNGPEAAQAGRRSGPCRCGCRSAG